MALPEEVMGETVTVVGAAVIGGGTSLVVAIGGSVGGGAVGIASTRKE